MNTMSVLAIPIHGQEHKERDMKKLLSLIFSILLLTGIGFSQGKWRFNPFTGTRDYYVEGLSLSTAASGDIIYYNGTIWTRLAKGNNDEVLTLAAGIPSWAAAGGADAFTVKIDAGAAAGYLGAAYNDGVLRVDQNELTYADGGDFITLGLANHDTARTALGLAIGTNVVAWDADLDTYAGITPSANIQTFLANANFAAMMADLSGTATGAFAWNAQNLTGIGTIGSGNIISTGTGEFQGTSVTVGDADTAGTLVLSDGSNNTITVDIPAIAGSWALTLPTVDGDANEFLQTDGAGNTTWAAESAADAFTLKVDAGATAGYFGVAGGDGIFRFTANHFTMADGGDFVTLSLADHATARAALGLTIGTDVVAWDTDLDTYAGITPSANIQTYLGAADYAAMRTQLGLVIGTNVLAEQTIGIADDNLLEVDDAGPPASGQYARFTANGIEGRTEAEFKGDFSLAIGTDVLAQQTIGIANDNLLEVDHVSPADDDFAKFTANGLEGRSYSETAGDLEASIETAIDTLANLTSVQGYTFTLAGNFVTQNNNVTINAVTAARTFTMNESLTIGDGNDGTLTYSGASKTLTVADNCTVNQDLQTTDDVQHADIYHTGFIGTNYYDCGNSGASITIDWNNGNLQQVTLTAVGVDITFTEPPHSGKCELWIIQDGTGSRTIDWEHEISPKWPGGVEPTLSTAAAAVDVICFTFIGGTTYRGLFNGDWK